MKRHRAAVSLVIRGDNRLLTVWNARHHGWTLPGGRVEPGETVRQALARELTEETTLTVERANLVYVAPVNPPMYPDRAARVYVFRVTPTDLHARAAEVECPIRWAYFNEFYSLAAFPDFYRCLAAAGVSLRPTSRAAFVPFDPEQLAP